MTYLVHKSIHKIYLLLKNLFATFVTSKVTIMNTRLKQFIAAENITQSQFADTIKVVRASVSHVIAGRNKPSYDFIKAIMLAYPNLNIDWLMMGKGKMYRNAPEQTAQAAPESAIPSPAYENEDIPSLFADDGESLESDPGFIEYCQQPEVIHDNLNCAQHVVKQRKATKVVIFFDDGTFQEM